MNTNNEGGSIMLDAMLILKKNGYTCKAMGMSFKITSPLGCATIETLTGWIDMSRK